MPTISSSAYSVTACMPHGSELVNEQPKARENWGGSLMKEPHTAQLSLQERDGWRNTSQAELRK